MRQARRLFSVMVVALMFCVAAVRAQIMDQMPEQAMVVVKVTNLQGFSVKLAKLATDLQLTAQVPQLADPLAALQEKLKITNGLDKAGDAAFAFVDPAVADGDSDNSVLVLWPITDYKAFIGNFPDAKEDGGISEVTFADAPKPAYVANWGKYAVMSPSKAIAALKPAGIKVSGATEKELASKDLVLYTNMAMVKAKLQPELAKNKDEILSEMEKNIPAEQQKYAPVAKALVSQLINIADSFLRDATAATFSVNLGENGISTTAMADFAPDSYIGNLAKSLKNSDSSMLTGMPSGKYLFFGGFLNDPAVSVKLTDDLLKPVTDEIAKLNGPEIDAANKYVAALHKILGAETQASFGLVAPSGALGQESIFQGVGVVAGDPATIKSAAQDLAASQADFMKAVGAPGEMKITVTPNAKTLDGVSFDLTHTDISFGNAPNAAQADSMMKMMYGPDGMNMLHGIVGDKLVVGFCASDQTLIGALASVKANDDPLSKLPGVAAVAQQLPKSRVMAMYIPVDEIVTTVGTYAGAMGMPIQIQLPPDLPPVGVTAGNDGTAIRIDSYTSTDLIKALVAQGMQLWMQRMGAGAPGGPGGL